MRLRLRGSASRRFNGLPAEIIYASQIEIRFSRRAGPVPGASKIPQSAVKPEVNELSDRDGAIHHLRVRKYACRNALTSVRLGDASQ